mgnify:CR=1 FL=1
MEYHVTWEIELTADSVEEAISIALEIQRDPGSLATHFEVVSIPNELGTTENNL